MGTPTPTETPSGDRPCGSIDLSAAYPNPVTCGPQEVACVVKVDFASTCSTEARWAIVTAAYRLTRQGTVWISTGTTVEWNLTDDKGSPVANGLYWFAVKGSAGKIQRVPILVLR
jgi:hypothetical protein